MRIKPDNSDAMLVLLIVLSAVVVSPVTLRDTATRLVGVEILFLPGDVMPDWHLSPDGTVPTAVLSTTAPGLGRLSPLGRARSYRLGQWVRSYYESFFGSNFESTTVQAHTSATAASAESLQAFLAGCFPPNSSTTRWDIFDRIGVQWQPIPYHDTSSIDGQNRPYRECPEAEQISNQLHYKSNQVKQLYARSGALLRTLRQVWNQTALDTVNAITKLYWDMRAQHETGHYWREWSDAANWTRKREDSMLAALAEFQLLNYQIEFAHSFLVQTRIGSLLGEIADSFYWNQQRWAQDAKPWLMLHSVARQKLVPFMYALGVWDHRIPPHSAALLLELHQLHDRPEEFLVQLWYLNETDRLVRPGFAAIYPTHLMMARCLGVGFDDRWMCPMDRFRELAQRYRPPLWWDWSCGVNSATKQRIMFTVTLVVAATFVLTTVLLLTCYLCGKCCHCSSKRTVQLTNTSQLL